MKYFIKLMLFILLSVPVAAIENSAQDFDTWKNNFYRRYGLKEADYDLVKRLPNCLEGDLRLIQIGSKATLMMGSKAIVVEMPWSSTPAVDNELIDDDCQRTWKFSFLKNKFQSDQTAVCAEGVAHFIIEIERTSYGFKYHQRDIPKQKTKKPWCELRLQPAGKVDSDESGPEPSALYKGDETSAPD